MPSRSMPSGLGRVSQSMRAKSGLTPQFKLGTEPRLDDYYSPGGARGAVGTPYNAPGRPSVLSSTPTPVTNRDWTAFGLPASWSPTTLGYRSLFSPTAYQGQTIGRTVGNIALGPFGGLALGGIGRLIGGLVVNTPQPRPGYRMPSFTSGGVTGVGNDYGVAGGYAGYSGGGPDERGGGPGGPGAAADPDRGGFGGENY